MSRAAQRLSASQGIPYSKAKKHFPPPPKPATPTLPALPFDPHELCTQGRLMAREDSQGEASFYGDIARLPKRFRIGRGVNEALADGQFHEVTIVGRSIELGCTTELEPIR